MPSKALMQAQAGLKRIIKPYLAKGGVKPRRIHFGPGRGLYLMLNRENDLQREFGLFEMELHGTYRHLISPEDTVYDVGAADGDTTVLFAKLVPRGRVVAFEPDQKQCGKLARNLDLNPELRNRVTVMRAFVGAQGDSRIGTNAPEAEPAPLVALDILVGQADVRPPDVVKIDVEGGEVEVLDGMKDILTNLQPRLVVEVHGVDRERECLDILQKANYAVAIVNNARWRKLYPELRPVGHNRWLVAHPSRAFAATGQAQRTSGIR